MHSLSIPRVKYLTSENDQNTNDPSTPFVNDIFYAAREGDIYSVQDFVRSKPNSVNFVDRYGNEFQFVSLKKIGNRALYYACLCGHPRIVQYLLQAGDQYDYGTVEGHRYYLASLTDGNIEAISPF